ncbi:MAG TPA: tetratricopeptide repeat protein [Burkholderiales bacterium]|jgi:predicted negative regulator of RcsB-dependent stress response|nr:tetratricopeptide repeat protein [Burkholderiales bacterium]
MAYDLEEQEQLAQLRGWWKDNGTTIAAVLLAVAVGAAGWQGWRYWQAKQASEAAALYDGLVKAMQAGDAKALRDSGGTLVESYPRTLYASMGALAAARFHFERGELKDARAQLQWVTERSPSEELRDVARLRLAGVLLDDKAYDEALALLGAKHAEAMAAQYAALKGDVLVAKKQPAEAKAAYRLAIEKAGEREAALRASVQLRLDALGG